MSKKKKQKKIQGKGSESLNNACREILAHETEFLDLLNNAEDPEGELRQAKCLRIICLQPHAKSGSIFVQIQTNIGRINPRVAEYDPTKNLLPEAAKNVIQQALKTKLDTAQRQKKKKKAARLVREIKNQQADRAEEWGRKKQDYLKTLDPNLRLSISGPQCIVRYMNDDRPRVLFYFDPPWLRHSDDLVSSLKENMESLLDNFVQELDTRFEKEISNQSYSWPRHIDMHIGKFDGPDILYRSSLSHASSDFLETITIRPFSHVLSDSEGRRVETTPEEYVLASNPKLQKYVQETESDKFKSCLQYAQDKLNELQRHGFSIERKTKDGLLSGKGDFVVSRAQEKPIRITLNIPPYRKKTDEWKQGIDAFFNQITGSYLAEVDAAKIAETEEALTVIDTFAERDIAKVVSELEFVPEFALLGHLLGNPDRYIIRTDNYQELFGAYEGFYSETELEELIRKMDNDNIVRSRYVADYGRNHGGYNGLYKLKKAANLNILFEKKYCFDKDRLLAKCRDKTTRLTDFEADYLYRLIAEQDSITLPDYMMLTKTIPCKGFMAYCGKELFDMFEKAPDPILTLLKGLIATEPCEGVKTALEQSALKDRLSLDPAIFQTEAKPAKVASQ